MTEVWEDDDKYNVCISYTVIPVLEFLKGTPYDDYAKAYIYGLRPSYVRVSTGCIKCDARANRVTVYVNDDNIIEYIEQEINVAFPFECTGSELEEMRPTDND